MAFQVLMRLALVNREEAPMNEGRLDVQLPAELEARTDELIRQLDELNQRIERALTEGTTRLVSAEPRGTGS